MKEDNFATRTMKRKIHPHESSLNAKKSTVSKSVRSAALWLRKHKQTNNGKNFEKI